MKITSFILLLLSAALIINGQDLSLSVAPTINNVFYYQFVAGGYSGNSKAGFNVSAEYIRSGTQKISWGFGLCYQYSRVEIVPAPMPPEERIPHTETVNLVTPGFKTVFNFRKEFYLTADPFIDIQLKSETQSSIDNQTGLGISLGFGKRIPISEGIFIMLEPRLWVHNVVPFVDNNLAVRLTVVGLKAGINLRKE